MKKSRFYIKWGISFFVIIAIAFAPKYWIPLFRGEFDIPTDIHWHAFFATSWIIIYCVQTILIKHRNINLHKNLGFLSILFALGVIVSGFYVSIGLVERALLANSAGAKPLLLVNLLDLSMFGILYAIGIQNRKNGIEHKRFITISAIVLLNAALFRIGRFFIGPGFPAVLLAIVLTSGMLILFIKLEEKHSQKSNKRLWKIVLSIIVVHIIRIPLAITPIWSDITDLIMNEF